MRRYDVGSSPDFSLMAETFNRAFQETRIMALQISNASESVGPVNEAGKDNVIEEPLVVDMLRVIVPYESGNSIIFPSYVAEICSLEGNIFTPRFR